MRTINQLARSFQHPLRRVVSQHVTCEEGVRELNSFISCGVTCNLTSAPEELDVLTTARADMGRPSIPPFSAQKKRRRSPVRQCDGPHPLRVQQPGQVSDLHGRSRLEMVLYPVRFLFRRATELIHSRRFPGIFQNHPKPLSGYHILPNFPPTFLTHTLPRFLSHSS